MTHTSWINERGDEGRDNERLEYLGDAVLELVAGEYLFNRFPNYDEGQLTQIRSSLVSTVALARLGEQLLLGETLRLGRGAAKSGARRLTSLHANAFEALVGAIFLDQGYRRAGRVFLSRIGDLSAWTDPNFKGRLQALSQERFGAPPQYRTLPANGDPRSRQYVAQVTVEGRGLLGEGRGGTKQAAEQAAARAAIDLLVAPVSKKRRRSRVPAPSPAAPASAAGPLASEPVAPDPPLHSAGKGSARRRPTAGAPAVVRVPGAEDVATLSHAAVAEGGPGAPTEGPTIEPVRAAPRRRRRRAAALPSSALQPSGAGAPPEAAGAADGRDEAAALRGRRRARAASDTATEPALASDANVGAPPPAAADLGSASAVTVADDPVRKRTHRGHRGGRRRSGRTATPEA